MDAIIQLAADEILNLCLIDLENHFLWGSFDENQIASISNSFTSILESNDINKKVQDVLIELVTYAPQVPTLPIKGHGNASEEQNEDQSVSVLTVGHVANANDKVVSIATIKKLKTKHSCKQCDTNFTLKKHLTAHNRKVHEEEEKLVANVYCTFCNTKSRNKSEGHNHVRRKHDKLLLFDCDWCVKKCETKDRLVRHVSKYHYAEKGLKSIGGAILVKGKNARS